MKKITILILLVSTSSAFSQQMPVEPKLLESMYKECTTQRNNISMLSDYHAALAVDTKNRNSDLEKKIKELEAKLKEYEK